MKGTCFNSDFICLNGRIGVSEMNSIRPYIQELFSTVNEPMLIVNVNGEVEYINKNAQELLNISGNEKRKLEMDENSKSSWTTFLNKIREQKFGTCVLNVKLSDCKYKKMKLEGYFVKKNKLVFLRIMNMLTASYKEIKDKYSTSLLDELSHGVVITNLEGIVLDINKKALQYLHCEYDEIINMNHKIVFNKLDDFEYNKLKYYQDLKNIGQATIVLRNIVNDKDQYFKVESQLNSRKKLIISTITDVTIQFDLNNQLMKQDYMKEVRQVAATIAHEIRNPMTSIKGFIELIKNSQVSYSDCQRYVSIIESELNRIDDYLKDLLNTVKPSKNGFEKVFLIKVINEVVELMQPYALKENIIIGIENKNIKNDVAILGNENRIKQVLINLVKNAIEVLEKGGRITVAIAKLNDKSVQISVQDNGTGISKENLDNLFKPFYTTKQSGTGLGLSIVKEIVEDHRGNIKVESKLNYGTTFYIEFPICEDNKIIEKQNNKIIEMWYGKSFDSIPIT